MVNTKCAVLFVASMLALGCVSAIHPMAQSLSQRQSEGGSSTGSSSQENVAGAALRTLPLNEIDDNYLSLSDEVDKRGPGKNFLRFGKSGSPMTSAMYAPVQRAEEEKRAPRNFLRFGRTPQRNFLRFGKSSPLQFGLDLDGDTSEEIFDTADNDNFFRYGKAADRNYLRFGRSTESQMKEDCNDCLQESSQPSSAAISTSSSSHKRGDSSLTSLSSTSDGNSYSKRGRTKRSVSAFYDDVEFMPLTPSSWASQYVGVLPESRSVFIGGPAEDDFANKDQKRSYSRSFLRYGRDPLDLHFLRYGKRGSLETDKSSSGEEDQESFTRTAKGGSLKNFLRFG